MISLILLLLIHGSLQTEHDDNMIRLDKEVKRLEIKLDTGLGKLKASHDTLLALVKSMDEKVGTNTDKIRKALSDFGYMEQELRETVKGLVGQQRKLDKGLETIDALVKSMDEKVGKNTYDIGKVEVADDQLRSDFGDMRQELRELRIATGKVRDLDPKGGVIVTTIRRTEKAITQLKSNKPPTAGCFDVTNGTISTQGSQYRDNINCKYTIPSKPCCSIDLTFTRFDTESFYDNLHISDANGNPLQTSISGEEAKSEFSGRRIPPDLTAQANTGVLLIFKTDGSSTRRGFTLNYEYKNIETGDKNCRTLYESGERQSGVYTITPTPGTSIEVYCDMNTAGGGWTRIQRRRGVHGLTGEQLNKITVTSLTLNFTRNWNEYKRGFSRGAETWLGLEKVYNVLQSSGRRWTMRWDFYHSKQTRLPNIHKMYYMRNFRIQDEAAKYKLTFDSWKTADGSKSICHESEHNNTYFSTFDRDNDGRSGTSCSPWIGGIAGWWYNACGYVLPNSMHWFYNHYHDENCKWNQYLSGSDLMIRPEN